MVVDGQRVQTRAEAGQLVEQWIAQRSRGGIPYGHHTRELGELGQLGGLPIHAGLRHTGGRAPTVEITLHGLPSAPATAALDNVHNGGLSLVRQLENRVAELPTLAARVHSDRATAAAQAENAAQALQAPFKHADALAAAQARAEQIAAAMQQRQHEPPAAAPAAVLDEDLAELQRLTRAGLTRAGFPRAAGPSAPSPVSVAPRPSSAAPRDIETER